MQFTGLSSKTYCKPYSGEHHKIYGAHLSRVYKFSHVTYSLFVIRT